MFHNALYTVVNCRLFFILCFSFNITKFHPLYAGNETLNTGSFIINMGITPQTFNNGLKPYGMLHDLITNYNVPVKWVINDTKIKDGTDFTYNSVDYKGAPFIVPAEFIDSTVASRISYWQTQGVVGVYTSSSLTVPVYNTVTAFPGIMIDSLSNLQAIVINYYDLAAIPSTAYTIGNPSGLNNCFDLWTNPHGDPQWSTHGYLYNFVTVQKSFIWGQCHAVSMMEAVKNPVAPFEQLNFLSTPPALQCWGAGQCTGVTETHASSAVAPFTYYYPADPVMQFMGTMSNATQAGSERWFIPVSTGGWHSTTKRGVTTASGVSPAEGVLLVYGRAYGDSTNGMVMYEAGHSLTSGGGNTPAKVSAIRAYFNFVLLAGKERKIQATISIPDSMSAGISYPVSATIIQGTAPFTYSWTSTAGGTFDDPSAASTNYTAPVVSANTVDIVKVVITDLCNRKTFEYKQVLIVPGPLPVTLLSFSAQEIDNYVEVSWTTASESNNDYFSVEKSKEGLHFELVGKVKGAGNSTSVQNYFLVDESPYQGTSYYRLKQTDFNGNFEYYNMTGVHFNAHTHDLSIISIAPNPFDEYFNVEYFSENREPINLELKNLLGVKVYAKTITPEHGLNHYHFDNKKLNRGIYFLSFSQENTLYKPIKLLKQDF